MGSGLTDLGPQQGFAAQTGAATVILASSHLGFSLSTTQACSGAVMGAGLGRKGGTVRWSTATRMFIAWGLTLPAAGLAAAGAEFLTGRGSWGVPAVAALLLVASAAIWLASRRRPVGAENVVHEGAVQAVPGTTIVTRDLSATIPAPTTLAGEPARPATV
jgi:PiT family inorganic phosphate transporter